MKNLSFCIIVSLVLSLGLQGCGASIKANKSPDFNEQIDDFFVVAKFNDRSIRFSKKFIKQLEKNFEERDIKYFIKEVDPLSLQTEEELQKEIEVYNPSGILYLTQGDIAIHDNTRFSSDGGMTSSSTTSTSLDLTLKLPRNNKPVWKAKVRTSKLMSASGNSPNAKYSVQAIFLKMTADKIIRR